MSWRLPVVSLLCLLPALAGCGVSLNPSHLSVADAGFQVGGSVHGGQQPVVGATVALMMPNTSQYGGAASVIASTTTDGGGSFMLPSYTCPANSGLVYLLATGGNAGSGVNPALAEAAVLGPCSGLSASTFVSVSEVTTVAAAYVLAPFASVTSLGTGIGAPLSNLQGLTNGFGPANNLVSLQNGQARAATALAGMVLPQAELNTLADILASCVNSTGATGAAAPCGMLFAAATPTSGVAPADTFQAALNIALNPGTNVAALFGLVSASAPFQPTLSAVPTDFAVAIQYNGAPITNSYGTQGIAIDSAGNAWIATGFVVESGATTHALTEISPAGIYLSGASGYGSTNLQFPEGVAIDASNNVYVTDIYANKVLKFAANGSLLNSFSPASLNAPSGIAVDTDGSLWIVNLRTISHVTAGGVDAAGSPYATQPGGTDIVLNAAGVWSSDYGAGQGANGYLSNYSRSRMSSPVVSYPVSGSPVGLAFDSSGNLWYGTDASDGGGIVGRFNASGGSNLTPIAVAYPLTPQEVFVDGMNHVWVNTYNVMTPSAPSVLLEYSATGALLSPATGFAANGTLSAYPGTPGGLAVDGSGNVWMSGQSVGSNGLTVASAFVTEVIGIAAPVVTPIAVAAANGTLGMRP